METIGTALTAAETGHLVFATLHTQDAPQTIDRIIDVFPPAQQGQIRAQLAIGLQGVVTQTLLPTADGQGRCVAAEVLVPTPGVRNLIREGKTHQIYSLIQTGGEHGMQTMDSSLAGLVRAGKITMATAESRSSQPVEMRRLVQGMHVDSRWPPDGRRGLDLQGRRRRRASPSKGELKGASKEAVTEQLARAGPQGHGAARRRSPACSMEITLVKRVKATELTVMTRQLATMISSGMTLLRAFYVLEDQIENKLLKETVGRRPRGHRVRPRVLRRRSPSTRRSSIRSTSPWCARARPAACSRSRWSGSPTSSRRTTRCAARSSARWPTRSSCCRSR